ncbi:MAG: hypothetical protein JWQ42_4867 [Edaphobacter sp.]|nr:hypothetical protein [Edaphobacter sp.]
MASPDLTTEDQRSPTQIFWHIRLGANNSAAGRGSFDSNGTDVPKSDVTLTRRYIGVKRIFNEADERSQQ